MQQKKISRRGIALRCLVTAALCACVAFIFHNSLEEAAASSLRSRQVTAAINEVLTQADLQPITENEVRKLAHFTEFAMLGFLLMACLRVYTDRFVRHISWPLLGGMTVALADERLQLTSAGRSPQITDVWIDVAGAAAGLLAALLLLLAARLLYTALRGKRREASA